MYAAVLEAEVGVGHKKNTQSQKCTARRKNIPVTKITYAPGGVRLHWSKIN